MSDASSPLALARAELPPLAPLASVRPDQHPARIYLASLAPGSRPAMRSALEVAAAILSSGALDAEGLPWAALRYPHLQALRARLAERYAPKTTNRYLSAVRGVLRAAWRLGQIDTDTLHRACDVGGVRGSRLPAGRDVAMRERQELFEACAADPLPARGARDAAVLALLTGTGIRRSEAVALDLANVDLEDGGVRVTGKGNKQRRVYLVDGARRALAWWLSLRGSEPGALLYRVLRGGHIRPWRLRPAAIGIIVERRVREAGLRPATPHDFRRTFTGDLLDAGADLSAAQALLGHASPTTTARYDRRGERARRKAAELVAVPFAGAEPSTPPDAGGVAAEQPTPHAVPGTLSAPRPTPHAQLRVRVLGTKVWRRLRLPLSASFEDLHQLLQDALGWNQDFHHYGFRGPSGDGFFNRTIATHPELEGANVRDVVLGDHLSRRGDECVYDHDSIGDWLCSVEVQNVRDFPGPEAWVLKGAGTAPPESYDLLDYGELLKRFRRGRVSWRESERLGGWRPDRFDKASLPRKSERAMLTFA